MAKPSSAKERSKSHDAAASKLRRAGKKELDAALARERARERAGRDD